MKDGLRQGLRLHPDALPLQVRRRELIPRIDPPGHRVIQGIGTGGEVPVASAYINEFIGAKKRGRFFLLYELIFPIGLLFAGISAAGACWVALQLARSVEKATIVFVV